MTDNFARQLGLNLCMIIAKYYLETASRKKDEFYFDAFLAILTNKIKIEKQIEVTNFVRKPPIVANALHERM